ncbi:MAG TPA: hypothetical protein P5293_05035 [Bacteroidales bacterium]|nr:hypothetical protein [Bacteroidales bacterium]
MEEILKVLGIEKLDESQITSIKEKLDAIVDVKSRERADSLLKEESEKLIEEYEGKFEEYKNDITSKFSNFVDQVLEEELKLPEKIVDYAKKGELYDDVIQELKVRLAIDEGVLNEEIRELLREAKEEIIRLKDELNKETAGRLQAEEDARALASHLYLRKKCDGLTESQRRKVIDLLGDLNEKTEIDRKFQIVVDTVLEQDAPDAEFGLKPGTQDPDAEAKTNDCICPSCGAHATTKGACASMACPSCGASMKDASDPTPAKDMGQGKIEVEDQEGKKVEEADDPFSKYLKGAVAILKENRF